MKRNLSKILAVVFVYVFLISPGEIRAENYTQEIWNENHAFYQKILKMPFNQELIKGTLNENIFRNYIIQDYHYLQNYRKVFGILLSKAPDEKGTVLLAYLIKGVDEEIAGIHDKYFKRLGITKEALLRSAPYPVTEFYNSYLVKTSVLEPFEVGLIATLPCHWIYYQIGIDIKRSKPAGSNRYQEWIDGYGTDPWETSDTKMFVDLIEYYMKNTTAENRRKMKEAFITAMKLEYMFWDGIYRGLRWVE